MLSLAECGEGRTSTVPCVVRFLLFFVGTLARARLCLAPAKVLPQRRGQPLFAAYLMRSF